MDFISYTPGIRNPFSNSRTRADAYEGQGKHLNDEKKLVYGADFKSPFLSFIFSDQLHIQQKTKFVPEPKGRGN